MTKRSRTVSNYLNDFLFVHYLCRVCEELLHTFLRICGTIKLPVAMEKTEFPMEVIVFLGIWLNGKMLKLIVPQDKVTKALHQLNRILDKKSATVKELQQLTGTLNFLTRAIVPGRVFTRRIYAKYSGKENIQIAQLKQHHHIRMDKETKQDCHMWKLFLENQAAVNRPFMDFADVEVTANILNFWTDASKNKIFGFSCVFGNEWTFGKWELNFIHKEDPSIAFLELFTLCVGVFTWQENPKLNNTKVIVFCDNQSVVHMVNNMMAGCAKCMYLLRLLALNNIIHSRRIFVRYIESAKNVLSDALARMDFKHFFTSADPDMNLQPEPLPENLWPLSTLWHRMSGV